MQITLPLIEQSHSKGQCPVEKLSQVHLTHYSQNHVDTLIPTYLPFFIIWIFPIWEKCAFKHAPSPVPGSEPRHILKHSKKPLLHYIELELWAQLQPYVTLQWTSGCYLQHSTTNLPLWKWERHQREIENINILEMFVIDSHIYLSLTKLYSTLFQPLKHKAWNLKQTESCDMFRPTLAIMNKYS
jgi:hypothetical protein